MVHHGRRFRATAATRAAAVTAPLSAAHCTWSFALARAEAGILPVAPPRGHRAASKKAAVHAAGARCIANSALPTSLLATAAAATLGSVAFGAVLWRRRRRKRGSPLQSLTKLSLQPSLSQVIEVLGRVDPALGSLARTVSRVWGLLEKELADVHTTGDTQGTAPRTGSLLFYLFAMGNLQRKQSAGFLLHRDKIPLVGAADRLAEVQRWTRFAIASYGAKMLVVTGLLSWNDLSWHGGPLLRKNRDGMAAAKFLDLKPEQILAQSSGSVGERKHGDFRPRWFLIEDRGELLLSVRGSANLDDIAIDLACENCQFLHGMAHEGIANAAAAVWEEAKTSVMKALQELQPHQRKRFVICGHSLGGAVALLLGLQLRTEALLPLPVLAFAAGPPPVFKGDARPEIEQGLLSVINGFDPVPHLSLAAAQRLLFAAARLKGTGLSWAQSLGLFMGKMLPEGPTFKELTSASEPVSVSSLRIPGNAIWLVDACAGRQVLAVDLEDRVPQFSQELPEISNAASALDHIMPAYIQRIDMACSRVSIDPDLETGGENGLKYRALISNSAAD